MNIVCSRCFAVMGQTADLTRTLDLCAMCHAKWVAELKRESNLMEKTMQTLRELMAKQPINEDFKRGMGCK